MAMNLGGIGGEREPEPMVEMNTTPLIDVMLVLLIMLIITIPIQLHALNIQLPTRQLAPPTPPVVITIAIDADGSIVWDGEIVPDRAALEARLRRTAALHEQPEVQLRPSKQVEYQAVARVLASAQRLGVRKLGIVARD